jgi:hypothetical protein
VDDLVQFLRERLDEDEQTARAAGGKWIELPKNWVTAPPDDDETSRRRVALVLHDGERAHILRHNPARVLAEIEAKRALLRGAEEWEGGTLLYYILAPLARVYRDHPDFDPAWLED